MTATEAIPTAPRFEWRQILANRDGKVGFVLTFVMVLIIAVGPFMAPYPPNAINLTAPNSPPSLLFLLGSDHLGRDVLSRVLCGGRSILLIPLVSVALAYSTAGLISIVAAYRGGWADIVISRICELLMSLPSLLKTLVLVAAFGPSVPVLIAAITISNMPGAARVARGAVMAQVGVDYILAAQARGEGTMSIVVREILPNIVGPVAADITLRVTWAIIALSTLSFLGLGVQPPGPDWGLMIQEARSTLQQAPLVAVVPACAIATLSIGLNFCADAVVRFISGGDRRPS